MKRWALLLAGAMAAVSAAAESEVAVFGGEHDNYARVGAHVRLAPQWTRDWGAWRLGLHPELELSRFRYTGDAAGPSHLDQAGVIALGRMVRGSGNCRPYLEAGLGAALFSRTEVGAKNFSTAFQFSQHLGLGLEIGQRLSVGWRYSHYSNGDIDMPNDGIDLHHLVVGWRF